jgi:tetratricopeptide (TPR) repeat protein
VQISIPPAIDEPRRRDSAYFDLGAHTRRISTVSPEAQRWFDRGLNWCFGFNHEEGVKCFRTALDYDPDCLMAQWGIAYGSGPFYNLTWLDFGEAEAGRRAKSCYEQIRRARSCAGQRTDLEAQLVHALARRFQKPHLVDITEFDRWDNDYAAEMRRVHHSCPDDHDVMALFAEALITRTPRRLWDVKTGLPAQQADTIEALRVCERSIGMADDAGMRQHPAIVHLHIHILEMSNHPERAMRSADILATLCPDAGHMNHMPGHVYVLCGDYEKSRIVSEKAIRADDLYEEYAGSFNYYTIARCHDLHLMVHTCCLLGQYAPAIRAADKLCAMLSKDVLSIEDCPKRMTMASEGHYSMRMHVLVRFGRWREIVEAPMPDDPDLYLVTTAMHHYAKGVAFAALKHFDESSEERERFHRSLTRIPADWTIFNNKAHDILAVAEKMLDGEYNYHKGDLEAAFAHLREGVILDDNLQFYEPWAWMHPPRHALAALLLERGHLEEAEQVYRDDLGLSGAIQRCAQHPNNVWALHGLVECLRKRDECAERPLLEAQLAEALSRTDVAITSSCMCRNVALTRGCCG